MACRRTFDLVGAPLTCVEAFIVPEIDTHPLYDGYRLFEYGTTQTYVLELNDGGRVPYPPPPQTIPTTPSDNYYRSLHATGGVPPYTWSVESGVLPEGLTLNSTTGEITGIPMPLNPQEINTHIGGDLSHAPFGGDRLSSYYPVVFKCLDAAGHAAYVDKDMFVNWVVRVQGSSTISFPEPIDSVLVPDATNGAQGPGSIFYLDTVSVLHFIFDGSFWEGAIPASGATDTEPGTKPLESLLGTYHLENGSGDTGTFTLS